WGGLPDLERIPEVGGRADGLDDFAAEDLQGEQRLVDETARFGAVLEDVRACLLRLDRELVHGIDVALDDPLRAVVQAAHADDGTTVLPHLRHEAVDLSSCKSRMLLGA